jgi:hypothetical protein
VVEMRNRFERGYTVTTEVKPKESVGDFVAGVVVCFLVLAFLGWLFG